MLDAGSVAASTWRALAVHALQPQWQRHPTCGMANALQCEHVFSKPPAHLLSYPCRRDIEKTQPALIIMAAHNKPGTQEGLGSVAEFLSRNCKRPMAIVHPEYAVGTSMEQL
jgi:nucleotide-binding universal stress UspA family protein